MNTTAVDSTEHAAKLPAIAGPRLPYHPAIEERFGVNITEWRALVDAVFPLAKEPSSVILALSYCKARNLDPFKKPVHIVPMWNAALKRMVETVWPGIGELRTTAFRTGQYAGRDEAKYGETRREHIGNVDLEYPEWCQVTVYRMLAGQRLPFPGPRVYWRESYASAGRDDLSPNSMWKRRPFGQIDKCAEAAALRAAFPEEVGNEYSAEEMDGRTLGEAIDHATGEIRTAPRSLAERMDALAAPSRKETEAVPAEQVDQDTGEITQQESEVMPSEPVPAGENVDLPRSPEPQDAAGGAETSPPAQGADDHPAGSGETATKTLADYDTELGEAAKRGTAALQEAWAKVPAGMKKTLKAALDRRHKSTAEAADSASAGANQGGEEKHSSQENKAGQESAATDPAPAADQPTTADEYVAYARAWFGAVTDAETARARWTAEKKLRNGLNLDPDMRDTLKDELEAKIAARKG